ncbi:unnamed protein product [Ectocarpus sp. 8 AP-2014]
MSVSVSFRRMIWEEEEVFAPACDGTILSTLAAPLLLLLLMLRCSRFTRLDVVA